MFSLDNLKVYDRALATTASVIQLAAGWDKRHAKVDQLVRASESVVLMLDRVALLVRGLCERIDKSLPDTPEPRPDEV